MSNTPNSAESLSNLGRRGSISRNTKSLEGPPSSPVKCGTGGGPVPHSPRPFLSHTRLLQTVSLFAWFLIHLNLQQSTKMTLN